MCCICIRNRTPDGFHEAEKRFENMKKIVWIQIYLCLLLILCSCDRQIPEDRNSSMQIMDQELEVGNHLFNANEMDSIEISAEDLLKIGRAHV